MSKFTNWRRWTRNWLGSDVWKRYCSWFQEFMKFPIRFWPSLLHLNCILSQCSSYRDTPSELDAASGTSGHTPLSTISRKIASQMLPGRRPSRLPAGRRFESNDVMWQWRLVLPCIASWHCIRYCTSSCWAGAHSRLSVLRHDMTCHSYSEIMLRAALVHQESK